VKELEPEHAPEGEAYESVQIGRQPIFDRKLGIFGYEMLFRAGPQNRAHVLDGNRATSRVILNSFLEIGLENLVGNAYAFFNLTRDFLLRHTELPFRSSRIALEVLEHVEVDNALRDALQVLVAQGFTIVLDDFTFEGSTAPLAGMAHIIKVDVQALDGGSLEEHARHLSAYPARLLAEKVETEEEFERCRELGFDYFQGYFFCRPRMIERRRLPESRLNVLRLLAALQRPDVEPKQLESIIRNDVSLNYKLLRWVNSAYYGLPITVKSVSHAIAYMGIDPVRHWVRLLLLAGLEDRPAELVRVALMRARMAERLTANLSEDTREGAFTVGLFSMLDALLQCPMREVVSELPLVDEVRQALLEEKGPFGRMLRTIRSYEAGDWRAVDEQELWSAEDLGRAYLDAVQWIQEQPLPTSRSA